MKEVYTSQHMALFLIQVPLNNTTVPMSYTSIDVTQWKTILDAHVQLRCPMPWAVDEIFLIKEPDAVHVLHKECGNPTIYMLEQVFMKFTNIRNVEKSVTAVDMSDDQPVYMIVEFDCSVDFV